MKKRRKKAADIGRKKLGITFFGVNTIQYRADIVVEAPADITESELVEAIDDNLDTIMPEPPWEEYDEVGIDRNDDEPSVWDLWDENEVAQVILQRDGDGKVVVRR